MLGTSDRNLFGGLVSQQIKAGRHGDRAYPSLCILGLLLLSFLLTGCSREPADARFILGRWSAYVIADKPADQTALLNHTLEFDPKGELRVLIRFKESPDEVVKRVGRWTIPQKGTLQITLDGQTYTTPAERVEYRLHLSQDPTLANLFAFNGTPQDVFYVR